MEAIGPWLIEYPQGQRQFHLWNLSDIHWGAVGVAKEQLRADIAEISADPFALVFLGGDNLDAVCYNDKRFDALAVDEEVLPTNALGRPIKTAHQSLAKELKPLTGKLLGVCYGNHEHHAEKVNHQQDAHETFCETLHAPDMKYAGVTELWFMERPGLRAMRLSRPGATDNPPAGARLLRVAVYHGIGAAATAGGKQNAMKRLADMLEGVHLVMTGHLHEQLARVGVRLTAEDHARSIGQKMYLAQMSGSYLRGYCEGMTSYAEQRGYHPSVLGATYATYEPRTRKLKAQLTAIAGD